MNELIFKLKKSYLCIENKKIIIASLLIFNLILSFSKYDIIDLNFFQFILYNIYNIYYLFMIFLVILIILFSNLQKKRQNLSLILKLKNKSDYIEYIIENFIFSICVVLSINFFVVVIFSLILFHGNYGLGNIPYYNISYFIYLIFFYVRIALIFMIYGIIIILLEKNFGKFVSLGGCLFFCLNLFIPLNNNVVENILAMKWVGNAYLSFVQYPTFMTEVFCSTLYILVLMIVVYVLIYLYKKNNNDVI